MEARRSSRRLRARARRPACRHRLGVARARSAGSRIAGCVGLVPRTPASRDGGACSRRGSRRGRGGRVTRGARFVALGRQGLENQRSCSPSGGTPPSREAHSTQGDPAVKRPVAEPENDANSGVGGALPSPPRRRGPALRNRALGCASIQVWRSRARARRSGRKRR